MATLIADTLDVDKAIAEENQLPAGIYQIRFYTTQPVSQENLQDIFDHLYAHRVDVQAVGQKKTKGLWYVSVDYSRPEVSSETISALPVAIIPLIAFGMIMALVGIGIFKMEDLTGSIGKLLLIVFGGTIVIAAITRKPLEAAATRYIERRF